MITKTTRRMPVGAKRTPVRANQSITSGIQNRQARRVMANQNSNLTEGQRAFVRQLQNNIRRQTAITAATNTTNIMARPDFMELLPLFVQKLYILDVFGSVAMKSRQQLIPYFKFIAENTKGVTKAGDVLSSPFVNRQGIDPNFTGRLIKNEVVTTGTVLDGEVLNLAYTPVLPNSVTITTDKKLTDNGNGELIDAEGTASGYINYSTGAISVTSENGVKATYEYDNENVGPHWDGKAYDANRPDNGIGYDYGARMAKGYLQLDEINLKAEAHEIACYWSIYSAFAAQQEYGANIADMAKEAAFSELTAEINSIGFDALRKAATLNPQFNWDASPVLSGAVVPSDYLNMFKMKLNQAAASIYQATRLTRPNRLVVGTNAASYISMIDSFKADSIEDTVGPYKLGAVDQFEVYVDPNYDPDLWVMCAKSNDIRRNSALFGEYMPLVATDAIGLANASVQQGAATMFATEIVNPETIVSGKILGVY